MSGTFPPLPHGRLSKLMSWFVVSGSLRLVGALYGVCGVNLPVENAVELVTILNVDPGGKVSLIARFSSGCCGELRYFSSARFSAFPSNVASLLGLKVGYEASARMAPVRGSMATAPAGSPVDLSAE